ncbi:hypothetical protein PM082_014925 [Marasmius tenuissimus]|nr:hypothetical protein PM082_014925 [Marasmius tenuissimus]
MASPTNIPRPKGFDEVWLYLKAISDGYAAVRSSSSQRGSLGFGPKKPGDAPESLNKTYSQSNDGAGPDLGSPSLVESPGFSITASESTASPLNATEGGNSDSRSKSDIALIVGLSAGVASLLSILATSTIVVCRRRKRFHRHVTPMFTIDEDPRVGLSRIFDPLSTSWGDIGVDAAATTERC